MKRLDQLFDLRYGQSLELVALQRAQSPDGVNFVSRAMRNNGVVARVHASTDLGEAGEITVALSGNGVLSSFVQPEPFVTGFHVMILRPKNSGMSIKEKLWWCRCILENRYRYSYGRQANRSLASLLVPDAPPSWLGDMGIPTHVGLSKSYASPVALSDTSSWRKFSLNELFDISKGKRVTKVNRGAGSTRFIGASDKNNGITDMCNLEPNFQGHCLTVPYNGSVGFAFYQDRPFFACDDVQVLIPKPVVSMWALLFVAAVIRHEKFRYTYGYKWNLARMKETTIRLPATPQAKPDWRFMESYIRGLPYSSAVASVSSPLE